MHPLYPNRIKPVMSRDIDLRSMAETSSAATGEERRFRTRLAHGYRTKLSTFIMLTLTWHVGLQGEHGGRPYETDDVRVDAGRGVTSAAMRR